jgi:hypothetical protein
MSFMIESEISKQYLREEDAVEGFREAVENGQVRLALQILVDIVEAFADIFDALTEDEDGDEQVIEEKKEEVKEVEAKKTEQEVVADKAEAPAKKTVKQEKPDTQEV